MGMARETFYLLCKLGNTIDFSNASVLQLGRQSGIVSYRQIKSIGKKFGYKSDFRKKSDYSFYRNYPTGDKIFEILGFQKIKSLDSNNFEGASFIYDMNVSLNNNEFGEYDLVYDGGTTEHIFDQLTVLDNIFQLVKVGGLIIHHTPANNFLDHGYHQPSPSFYYEYYMANGFDLIESYLIESTYDFYRKRKVYPYKPLMYENLSYGGWGNNLISNWFVVKKTEKSTSKKLPQQQRYTEYFHVYTKPLPNNNKFYRLIVNGLDRNKPLKYNILQTKHWVSKISRFDKYIKTQKKPKPIFYT